MVATMIPLYPWQVEALSAKVRAMLRPEQVHDPEHLKRVVAWDAAPAKIAPCVFCGKPGIPFKGAYGEPPASICADCVGLIMRATGVTLTPEKESEEKGRL